ncbi:MAG: hypothetical protein IIY99_00730 [Firmicutes bacterium]|nr:hypothetical protein [Bacillota bacterium]
MKKIFLVVLMLMVVFTMAACGGESSGGQSGDAPTAEVAFPQEVFITMNGTEVRVGDNFANVEGKIGEEVRPSETLEPCDPNFETATVEHYYDGVHITTNEEGIIATISLDIRDGETDSAFAGKVKLGDPTDSIKEVLGDPADEDDMFISYYFGDEEDCNILIYKDEAGNGTLDGLVFSCGRLTMVEQG